MAMQYIYGTDTVQQGFNKVNENFLNVPSETTAEILQQAQEYTDQQISPILSQLYGYNFIIGGDFSTNPWQRGTSFESIGNNTYTADRFRLFAQGKCTIIKDGIWLKMTPDTGNTGINSMAYYLDVPEILLGETLTLSFYAKASEDITYTLYVWNGKNITKSIATKTVNLTTDEQRVIITFTIPTTLTDNILHFWFNRMANLPNKSIWISRVKLELGSVATEFVPENPAETFLKCARYYYISGTRVGGAILANMLTGNGNFLSANVRFPVQMRIKPTVTIKSLQGTENKVSVWASAADQPQTVNVQYSTLTQNGFNALNKQSSDEAFSATTQYAFQYVADAEIY